MPSKIIVNNYYSGFTSNPILENYSDMLFGKNFRLEKIISKGHKTPKDKWIVEETNEFVMLLKGKAELLFEGGQTIKLVEGDFLIIPKNTKHKILHTSRKPLSYWLTLHYK